MAKNKKKSGSGKKKGVNQQPTTQNRPPGVRQGVASPYHPLIKAKEILAIKHGQVLYRIVKRFAAPAANTFLISKGKMSAASVDVDFQSTMTIVKDEVKADPKFLVKPLTRNQLIMVSAARNEADHDNYPLLLNNALTVHFPILKDFCESVGDQAAATNVQRLWNHVQNGDFSDALSFSFHFTTVYDENVAFSLCEIIYGIISSYLTFAMWRFRKTKYPLAVDPPPIDAYANLKLFKSEQLLNVDYLAPGGAKRGDTATLKASFDARIKNRHSWHTTTFADWETDLNNIIQLLGVLNDPGGVIEVTAIRDTLISARTNGTEVNSGLFPTLF